jgi:AcrR family transcriptional regulator
VVNNRRGRPRGRPEARERLISVVSERISAGDLGEWSSRQIAAEADVSHSLVNYHFGGRRGLLAAAHALTVAPHQVIEASRRDGRLDPSVLIGALVAVWEHPGHGQALAGLARSAIARTEGEAVVAYLQDAVVDTLVAELGIDRGRRLALTLIGTIMSRYVIRLPSMTALSTTELVRLMRLTSGV